MRSIVLNQTFVFADVELWYWGSGLSRKPVLYVWEILGFSLDVLH